MNTALPFVNAVRSRLHDDGDGFGILPTVLTKACIDVLPVDGAGLSVVSDLRVPLGSSSPDVALAEQLQVTLGVGPCLAAAEAGHPLWADEMTLAAEWPVLHNQLVQRTPFRSIMSTPLDLDGYVGALDLYSTSPTIDHLGTEEALRATVTSPLAALLRDVPTVLDSTELPVPAWMQNRHVESRFDVWIAVGVVLNGRGGSSADALALLRGYAFATARTLDEAAADLVYGTVDVAQILDLD